MCFPVCWWTKRRRRQLKRIRPPFGVFSAICSPTVGWGTAALPATSHQSETGQPLPFCTDQAASSVHIAKGKRDPDLVNHDVPVPFLTFSKKKTKTNKQLWITNLHSVNPQESTSAAGLQPPGWRGWCPGVTKSCPAPLSWEQGAAPRAQPCPGRRNSPFQCAQDEKHQQTAETLQCSCIKLHRRGGGWGNEEQPYILPRTGLGLRCSAEGLFSFILDWIAATGALRENMAQRSSSVAHGIAGLLARAPARTQHGSLEVPFFHLCLSLPPFPSQGAFNPFG